jgi:hypothetical protein
MGNIQLQLVVPHTGGRVKYNGVMPGAPKGSLVALLSCTPSLLMMVRKIFCNMESVLDVKNDR